MRMEKVLSSEGNPTNSSLCPAVQPVLAVGTFSPAKVRHFQRGIYSTLCTWGCSIHITTMPRGGSRPGAYITLPFDNKTMPAFVAEPAGRSVLQTLLCGEGGAQLVVLAAGMV